MDNSLQHSGTKGMRWGVRRWQNPDGSLTPEGRIHYGYGPAKEGEGPTKHKSAGEMSNEELKERTERLRLQRSYQEEINNHTERSKSYTQKKLEMLRDKTIDALINKTTETVATKFVKAVFERQKTENNNSNNNNNNNSGSSNNSNNNNNNNNSNNNNNNSNSNSNNNGSNGRRRRRRR